MIEENRNPLMYLFGKTWQYSEGNRKNVVLYWIMFVLVESIDVFGIPILWATIIDIVARQGIDSTSLKRLYVLLCLVIVRVLVVWSLHGSARLIELVNAFKVRANYRRYLTKGLLTLPLDWHTDHHSGDTIDKITKGTNALYEFSEGSFNIIYCLVRLVGCYFLLAYLSYPSAFIVFVMMLVSAWVTIRFDRVLIDKYRKINKQENLVSESIFDAVSNVSTVIILRVERLVFDAIMNKVEEPFELYSETNRLNEIKWFFTSLCCSITNVLVLGVYFWQHLGSSPGTIAGTTYLLTNYLNQIGDLFFRFTSMYGDIVKRKYRVINAEDLAQDFTRASFANHILPLSWSRLIVSSLNFSYNSSEEGELHLDDISFSVSRGEKVALIGETGSGKTTFLKVMRDLYHPKSLTLQVENTQLEQTETITTGFEGISRAISLVPQNPEIFSTSILSNITMGADYDLSFVRKFTDMACFTDVVTKLPKQFETSIKEKGVNLSGGQQQRLALSRGLLACHDKDIVLLDEPTSSLDVLTQMIVYQNIFREFQNKTVISTVHQLNLLPLFDRICVFDKGKIVGTGTIEELIVPDICPAFASLWVAAQKTSHV